jgi:putative aldouronate transport system permease protein
MIYKFPGQGKFSWCRRKWLPIYLLMISGFLFFIIYRYIPMAGLVMVFTDYRITRGLFAGKWSGLANFAKLFSAPVFPMVMRNTIVISLFKLFIGFPIPIIIALMLNEIRNVPFKRTLQTVMYLPHFVSWVVVGSIINVFFAPDTGALSIFLLKNFGIRLDVIMNPDNFIGLLIGTDTWKEFGWNTIIYLAAITSIDSEIYEAATVDGANKFQQLITMTLPCLIPVIMTMFLLRVGRIFDAGFEQIFILQNDLVYEVSEVLDTYVYKLFLQGNYVISATSGLFKSIIGLFLVHVTNRIAKGYDQQVI